MKEKIIEKLERYVEELLKKPALTQEEASMLTYWLSKVEHDEWRKEMAAKAAGALGGGCCEL